MHDDKRLLREMKRTIKKAGNRKRRRFLKNVVNDAEAFDFGDDSSAFMNEPRPQRPSVSESQRESDQARGG